MSDFREIWSRFHPGINPVGYMMLRAGAQHWVRFHSLPESQRYPNDDS